MVIVALLGCTHYRQADADPERSGEWHPLPPSAHVVFARAQGPETADQRVLRDQPAWDSLWATIAVPALGASPPLVDFERESLLVVAAGVGGDADSIAIDGLATRGDTLLVRFRRWCPASPATRVSYATHVVRVRRPAGPVSFQEMLDETCREREYRRGTAP